MKKKHYEVLGGDDSVTLQEVEEFKVLQDIDSATVLLSVNRNNGNTYMSFQVLKDNKQIIIGALSENSQEEKDRTLALEIEAAILKWLEGGI